MLPIEETELHNWAVIYPRFGSRVLLRGFRSTWTKSILGRPGVKYRDLKLGVFGGCRSQIPETSVRMAVGGNRNVPVSQYPERDGIPIPSSNLNDQPTISQDQLCLQLVKIPLQD